MRSLPHISLAVLPVLSLPLGSSAQFVTLEGRRFMLNGQEFYPMVINYGTEFVANQFGQNEPEEIHYSPAAVFDRIPQNHFECGNPAVCDQQLREHFQKVAEMGFNTIRLVGANPEAFRAANGQRMYKLKVKHIAPYGNEYFVGMSTAEPEFTDPMSERYFFIVRQILDAADFAGLKVILLTGTEVRTWPISEDQVVYGWEDAVLYAKFLQRLAWHLRDHPALMAYDLINEPAWRDRNDNIEHLSKAEVCQWTSLWYDAITSADPNHLVTIGGAGKHDIGSWDPAVMKIDFYSPHPYLEDDWAFANIYDMPIAMATYMAELYWLGATTEMPWIVGETSFSANDGTTDYNDDPNFICLDGAPEHHVMPFMHGSEQEQAEFAAASMAATRAYRGSGYSWWYFQDGRSHPYQTATPSQIRSNYFGALGYGDGTDRWRDKPMVAIVRDYEPAPLPAQLPEPPPAYWNWHALPNSVYRTYHLRDQNQEPVANGIALVKWEYENEVTPQLLAHFWARAVSNGQGDLVILEPEAVGGFNPAEDPLEIKVDVPGAARLDSGTPWPHHEVLSFHRQIIPYTRTISDMEVVWESGSSYAAWAELTVQDGVVYASGSENDRVVFEARHWVRASGESHIGYGSEAQLRTAKTFPDCSYPSWGMPPELPGAPPAPTSRVARPGADIQLRSKPAEPLIRAFPDPCSDALTIQTAATGNLAVRDALGRLVCTAVLQSDRIALDTRPWEPGSYTLTVKHTEGMATLRIIVAR